LEFGSAVRLRIWLLTRSDYRWREIEQWQWDKSRVQLCPRHLWRPVTLGPPSFPVQSWALGLLPAPENRFIFRKVIHDLSVDMIAACVSHSNYPPLPVVQGMSP
jgi:hypothetical protein